MPALIGYGIGVLLGKLFAAAATKSDGFFVGLFTHDHYVAKYTAIWGCIGALIGYFVDLNDESEGNLRKPGVIYVLAMVITGVMLGGKLMEDGGPYIGGVIAFIVALITLNHWKDCDRVQQSRRAQNKTVE